MCVWSMRPLADLVAVDEDWEKAGAAFVETAAVVGEVHAEGGFAACGEGVGSRDFVGDEAEEVVAEGVVGMPLLR